MQENELTREWSISAVSRAVAAALKAIAPEVPVYAGPIVQEAALPSFFISFGTVATRKQVGSRFWQTVAVKVCYAMQAGLADGYQRALEMAQRLDEGLELLPYPDGLPLRTTARRWTAAPDALRYSFQVSAWVSQTDEAVPMQALEGIREAVKA